MQPPKRRPVLRAAAPSLYLDERSAESSTRLADDYGNRFLNHWFVEAQAETALPELRALGQILRCNAEDWGKEEFAANCVKTALGLSRQMEHVWPGLYQLAALIKERGYYTQDIESWELKKTLLGKTTFEEWFTAYIHPSFEAFTRMEAEYKLAEQTGAPLPRQIDLSPKQQAQVVAATQGYGTAAGVVDAHTAPVGRPPKTRDNVPGFDSDRGNSGVDTYRRIQKLARGGNAQAAALLDQIDRKETTPHAAYIELGLRRPQITVQLEPDLHDQLKAWTETNGATTRDVVEDALEMFFRRMADLEEAPKQDRISNAELDPAPSSNGFGDLLGDVQHSRIAFQGMTRPPAEPEPEPEPTEQDEEPIELPPTDELEDTPPRARSHSRKKKPQPPAPELEDGAYITQDHAALVAQRTRQTLDNHTKAAKARGDGTVRFDSPDPRYVCIERNLAAEDTRWRVFRAQTELPDDQPRRYAAPRHAIDDMV